MEFRLFTGLVGGWRGKEVEVGAEMNAVRADRVSTKQNQNQKKTPAIPFIFPPANLSLAPFSLTPPVRARSSTSSWACTCPSLW